MAVTNANRNPSVFKSSLRGPSFKATPVENRLPPALWSADSTNYWYIVVQTAMAKNTSISLGDHFSHFVDERVAEGRYGSVSDVVRAGLRLLEEHETKLEALRAALIAGENSGPAAAFDVEDFVRQKRGSKRAR